MFTNDMICKWSDGRRERKSGEREREREEWREGERERRMERGGEREMDIKTQCP